MLTGMCKGVLLDHEILHLITWVFGHLNCNASDLLGTLHPHSLKGIELRENTKQSWLIVSLQRDNCDISYCWTSGSLVEWLENWPSNPLTCVWFSLGVCVMHWRKSKFLSFYFCRLCQQTVSLFFRWPWICAYGHPALHSQILKAVETSEFHKINWGFRK